MSLDHLEGLYTCFVGVFACLLGCTRVVWGIWLELSSVPFTFKPLLGKTSIAVGYNIYIVDMFGKASQTTN